MTHHVTQASGTHQVLVSLSRGCCCQVTVRENPACAVQVLRSSPCYHGPWRGPTTDEVILSDVGGGGGGGEGRGVVMRRCGGKGAVCVGKGNRLTSTAGCCHRCGEQNALFQMSPCQPLSKRERNKENVKGRQL